MPRPDRTRASATGTMRTIVSESTAYSRTFQEIPRATTSGMSDPNTNHTAADTSVPTSLVSCSRSSATSSRPTVPAAMPAMNPATNPFPPRAAAAR